MIEVKNLSRKFGELVAVNDISFKIGSGQIVGFLGPNAAGKTTTLRMLIGYLQPTSGEILINGKSIFTHPLESIRQIGYLPESNALYDEMSVYDYLRYMGSLRGLDQAQFETRLDFVIDKCGLKDVISQIIGTLSKGYRQRTGLTQAILHDPPILILDEPTNGLDPNQIFDIRELIFELGSEKTVLISSHIMQEIQAVSDRIMIINRGSIIIDEDKELLVTQLNNRKQLVLELEAGKLALEELIAQIPELEIHRNEQIGEELFLELSAPADIDLKRLVGEHARKHKWLVLSMFIRRHSLEEVFYNLTRNLQKEAPEDSEAGEIEPEETSNEVVEA
ncbi:MAG: ATP-binding cassette domain-containing protein [Candidatus Cloacimonetes bacterium]|nr:ATP-binding cassette domain-containing protein [Candidatus Cloacimonadota bacterium]